VPVYVLCFAFVWRVFVCFSFFLFLSWVFRAFDVHFLVSRVLLMLFVFVCLFMFYVLLLFCVLSCVCRCLLLLFNVLS
jgi:hypothetical protein